MKRVNIHGAIIGTGYYNEIVRVFDPGFKLWRIFDLINWCIKYNELPHYMNVVFNDPGVMVVMVVVPCGRLKGIASENANQQH